MTARWFTFWIAMTTFKKNTFSIDWEEEDTCNCVHVLEKIHKVT